MSWGELLDAFNVVVLVYFVLLNGAYLIATFLAYGALREYGVRIRTVELEELLLGGSGAPPITLIAPAYNEEATCVESTRSLLTLRYPEYEILVVNDGSRDRTTERMIEAFEMRPAIRTPMAALPTATVRAVYRSRRHRNLWLIDKENGGKADALNAGLNYARTPLFCALDADTLLEPDALGRVVRPFLIDERTIAAGGIIRIVNGCTVRSGRVTEVRLPDNLLARLQALEYLRAFLSGRMGWDAADAMLIISGAFGIFRRPLVVEAGGFALGTVGEDMELVVRLHRFARERRLDYRITFVPDPVAWTECPESVRVLGRQRDRWQRGLVEALGLHRRMLLRPRYGRIGLVAFPYFYFLEALGPIIEVLGYVGFALAVALGRASPLYIVAFIVLAFLVGMCLSIAAVALEELSFRRYQRSGDLFRLLGLAVLENFGYRQLSTYWRARGMISAARKVKGWGAMERKGFSAPDAAA